MLRSGLYKGAHQRLSMGAREAVVFLDALRHHGLLFRRTVAQYVMPPLLGGVEVRDGSPAYRTLEEALYREAIDQRLGRRPRIADDPSEETISWEVGDYLREAMSSVYDRRHRLCGEEVRYSRHTRDAFLETRELLGVAGMRYLGLSHYSRSLNASRTAVDGIRMEEIYAQDVGSDSESGPMADDYGLLPGWPVEDPAFGSLVSDPFPGDVAPEPHPTERASVWPGCYEPFAPASTQMRRSEARTYSNKRDV